MHTTLKIDSSELNSNILDSIKKMFKGKTITIDIYDYDETEYLLSSSNNKQRLTEAVENVATNANLVTVDLKDLKCIK